jgi:hypothetical protein
LNKENKEDLKAGEEKEEQKSVKLHCHRNSFDLTTLFDKSDESSVNEVLRRKF